MTALEPAAKHTELLAIVVLSLQMYQMEISPVSESTRMACTALLVGWQRVIWVSLAGSSFQAIPKFQSAFPGIEALRYSLFEEPL